jgi:glyoxylase-like metal-dependent hydrolase (beta-lactamase superfamily II)
MTHAIRSFHDPASATFTHVVYDPVARRAAIVDPVLDYDPVAARTGHRAARTVLAFLREAALDVDWIIETHAHADHLSAAQWFKHQVGGRIGIGESICEVQAQFKDIYHLDATFRTDGTPFDHLFGDGECFRIGAVEICAMAVPGHTPADMAYRVGNDVFVGDTLFMPDVGSARCDFPGGDPARLYRSARTLLALPPTTGLYLCHDYPPAGREPCGHCSVAEQRRDNIHLHDGIDEAHFVALRRARDATLPLPALMLPAIQVNIRAGQLPPPEDNGVSYLKIPVDRFAPRTPS